MEKSAVFHHLMEEYGSPEQHGTTNSDTDVTTKLNDDKDQSIDKDVAAALMQEEDRNTGSVAWSVYKRYLQYAGSSFGWFIIIVALLALTQGAEGSSRCAHRHYCSGYLIFLCHSHKQSFPGFLDRRDYSWFWTGTIHRSICRSWSVCFKSICTPYRSIHQVSPVASFLSS